MRVGKYILIGLLMFVGSGLLAQQAKWNMAQKKQMEEANYHFELTDYLGALPLYQELYEVVDSSNSELAFRIGACLLNSGKNKKKSAYYFKKASENHHIEAMYYYAKHLHSESQFDAAIRYFDKYKRSTEAKWVDVAEIERLIAISQRAKEVMEKPTDVEINNLGKDINSSSSDYAPLITADASMLMFTSRKEGSLGNEKDPYGKYYEDIYSATKDDAGNWSKAENIGAPINTATHDASTGLSSEGNMMVFFRTSEDLMGGDLYWTIYDGEKWSEPIMFGENINSEYQETSACFNSDGTVMYFSSNRPEGFGGKDIYRSVKFANGDWSLPVNLGPVINSQFDEDAPFMHPDGKTLVYSSNGHNTIGGFDIFRSELDDEGEWSEPFNMQYPINTVNDDLFFVLTADGENGYFSSERNGGLGGQDIYMAKLPFQPKLLCVIKGQVLSSDSTEIVKAKITVFNQDENKLEGMYHTNSTNGKFLMVLPPNKTYQIVVDAPGFFPYTENIVYSRQDSFSEVNKTILMESKSSNE